MRLRWNKNHERVVKVMVIIALILIIAGIFFPLTGPHPDPSKAGRARIQIQELVAAINQYETMYGNSRLFRYFALTNPDSDFTFGTFRTSAETVGITNAGGFQANNSEVIATLLDLTEFENGKKTLNTNHFLNPQRVVFLNAKVVGETNLPGIGADGVYRDPWGNPYIITIDFNNDGKCRDAFYRLASVSEKDAGQLGFNGLKRATPPPYTNAETSNSFEAPVTIMVWSLGPDGKADPSKKASEGVNKDNIISW